MLQCKKMAKDFSMVKSGNMRNNSIHAYITPKGFRVVQRFNVAFYGAILNEAEYTARSGSLKGQTTKGWWTTKTYSAIRKFIYDTYNGQYTGTKRVKEKIVKKPNINSTFLKSIPKG